jgi:hypothetical protein
MKTTAILSLATLAAALAAPAHAGQSSYSSSSFASYASPPAAPEPPKPIGSMASPPTFKPFKGSSLYSPRGGLNPDPKPAKPKGYIDLYHPKTKSTF